jgi:hypothetical protein
VTRARLRGAAACLWLILAAAACGSSEDRAEPPPDPPRGTPVPFTRMKPREMLFVEPGATVIRTSEEWRALWKRYRPPPGEPPAVEFARNMVAVVYMGAYSSCMREEKFVRRVEQVVDTLFVVVHHDPGGTTCDMLVEPVDMVLLPQSELPVRFIPARADLPAPPPARWLEPEAPDSAGAR